MPVTLFLMLFTHSEITKNKRYQSKQSAKKKSWAFPSIITHLKRNTGIVTRLSLKIKVVINPSVFLPRLPKTNLD